jgi:superfamily II DNA or RNA helicase
MPLTHSEQLLLDALKALPPNRVYEDTERKTVFKGFRLYNDRRVTRISWDVDLGRLIVDVIDGRLVSVVISLDEERLLFQCRCNGDPAQEKCEHVVCALLTTVHLLKPHLFKMAAENQEYREHLMDGLMKRGNGGHKAFDRDGKTTPLTVYGKYTSRGPVAADKPMAVRIILEEAKNRLRAYVEKDGERFRSSMPVATLPAELRFIMNFSHREDMSVPLSVFLTRWKNDYPVYFHDEKGFHKVELAEDISCTTWTEFDASANEILVRKGCAMGGDQTPADIFGGFAFNTERTRISYIKDRLGWGLWSMIRDACRQNPRISPLIKEKEKWTISIPKEIFGDFHICFDKPDIGDPTPFVVYKVRGEEVTPLTPQDLGYRIMISPGKHNEEEFLIRPECTVGNYSFLPSRRILSFPKTVEWGQMPLALRTRKRKPILLDAFFHALTLKSRKVLDEYLKGSINEITFGTQKFALLARRLIRESLAELRSAEMQLHYTDGTWQLLCPDREKETMLFLIPYAVFGSRLFERIILNDAELTVSRDDALKGLHMLRAMAADHGIDLCLDGQPIELATWEFELDATAGTIDWFEIRPEIRCNGETIGREIWEQALARKGVILRNGSVHILDEKSLLTLSALAQFTEADKSAAREIVAIPRLRIIELLSLRGKGITVKLSLQDEEVMTRLVRFERIEERRIPDGLTSELRHYQKEGYYWLSFLYENRFGACLADDMGLGKTIQAIALLGALKERKVASRGGADNPSLIVVPPSLIFNWEKEIAGFYPDLKVYVYRGKGRSVEPGGYDVILTSYGLVLRDIDKMKDRTFNVIIFDEAQTIKNIFANTTGAVRQLKGYFKLALTGTPVENHIGEYFSIMDLVLPGLLGEYREFQGQARQDIASFIPVVTERTRPFVLRRTKENILKELPPKIERDVYLDLTEKQKKFYTRTVEEVRTTIDEAYRSNTGSQAKIIALTAIMKLRQICLTPQLLVPDLKDPSPKIEFLTDKLEELSSEAHSSLVFSQFTSFLDIVEEEIRSKGLLFFRLDGSTPVVKRKEIVEGFQDSKGPAVFLLSLKAGGQGLNLTRATYVFHLDPWWNPAVENQASDRSHRIGQKHKVIVTRLLMRHTVEEKMLALKQRKLSLYKALMDSPERSAGRSITREDFNFLLS